MGNSGGSSQDYCENTFEATGAGLAAGRFSTLFMQSLLFRSLQA